MDYSFWRRQNLSLQNQINFSLFYLVTNSSGGFESRTKKMLKTRNYRCWAILVLWQQLGGRQVMDLPTKWWPLWHINRRPGGRCPMLPDRAGKTNKMGNVAIISEVLGPAWTLFRLCVVCHGLVCPTIGGIDTLFAGQGQTASCSGTNAL